MEKYDGIQVRITDNAEEAKYMSKNKMPYIVHLHEGNKNDSFPNGAYCVENPKDVDDAYRQMVYCRTKGLPLKIAETERLVVREIATSDVPRLYELYKDASITRYMEPLFEDYQKEMEYTKSYIENIYGFYGYGMWIIELKDSGVVIGRAGVEFKDSFEGLELGFMLGVEYQHKGYAFEACQAVLAYAKANLEQELIRAVVHKDNLPSRRLCEKLGFGMYIKGEVTDGNYVEYRIINV